MTVIDNNIDNNVPNGCEVSVSTGNNHTIFNFKCIKNNKEILNFIILSILNFSSCGDNNIIVHLNMELDLKLYEISYLLSGHIYTNNCKVAYVYNKLADYVDSDLIEIMKGDNNCNLFNNTSDAELWLFDGIANQS